jgi:hypothetical protein
MQRSSRPARTPSNLSESVQQRLNMYALAATAAGVGMLALTRPAEAKIVYTPAHVSISQNSTIPLDLNHDGINDFSFSNFYAGWTNSGVGALLLKGAQGNGFWASTNSAAALPAGVRIGPKGPFRGYGAMANMFQTFGSFQSWGPWVNVKRRYLGLKFSIREKIHYGWARLNVTNGHGGFSGTITGYAYETTANKPIITGMTKGPDDDASFAAPTPEPVTLGLLALGSPGLSIWLRKSQLALRGKAAGAPLPTIPQSNGQAVFHDSWETSR